MNRRELLRGLAVAQSISIKHPDKPGEYLGFRIKFWGWRIHESSNMLSGWWTATSRDMGFVSPVFHNQSKCEVRRYFYGDMMVFGGLSLEEADSRGARDFSESELDRVFSDEKQAALNALKAHLGKSPTLDTEKS
jgi:hypothetical protein